MDAINAVAARHGLIVIEDAAQALQSSYDGNPAGALGQMAAISFHATKNIQCGEGGALIVMDPTLAKRAEIVREKGTNRSAFFRGEVDKYSWVDIGSSFLLNEMSAAFLSAQLENASRITEERFATWNFYHEAFAPLEGKQLVRRPIVPKGVQHNAHIYYLLLTGAERADRFLVDMRRHGIHPTTHYVPLHSAPAGRKFGRAVGPMTVTDRISDRLIRLPLWCGMGELKHIVVERAAALLEA
jgi:dTDP-4-amino-4,6-dideoxygalactose transaminase